MIEKHHTGTMRAEARRHQILEAAEVCCQQYGLNGASMSAISKTANMSAGHIYNYFENKEAIIAALAARHVEKMFSQLDEINNREKDFIPILQKHARTLIEDPCTLVENGAIMFEILAAATRNPKIAEIIHAVDCAIKKRLILLIHSKKTTWSEAELSARVDVLMGLFKLYASRCTSNPDIDKIAFTQIVCDLIAQLFEEKQ